MALASSLVAALGTVKETLGAAKKGLESLLLSLRERLK